MRRIKQILWIGFIVVVFLTGATIFAVNIDLEALVQETQKTTEEVDKISVVWWVPEEFWRASFAEDPSVTPEITEAFLNAFRPYTMVIVYNGTMGIFGNVTYKSEAWIMANTRLIDSVGVSYAPRTENEIGGDARLLLQIFKPYFANVFGALGENMYILLFPATTVTGTPIASATQKGAFTIIMGSETYKWRLPLDSLLPAKKCPRCEQECKGSWNFCPWCGENLSH